MNSELVSAIKARCDAAKEFNMNYSGQVAAVYGEYWRDVAALLDALEDRKNEIIQTYDRMALLGAELDRVTAERDRLRASLEKRQGRP